MNISGIPVADAIINLEYKVMLLESVIDKLLLIAPPNTLTKNEMMVLQNRAVETVKKKYPNAGIEFKEIKN